MTTVYPEAVNQMLSRFRTDWESGSAAIVGYVPEVRWPRVVEGPKPAKEKFWARVSTQGVTEEQSTLSNCVGEPGKKHYEATGLVFIQLFFPKAIATAEQKGKQLAVLARNAFRGKTTPGGVWFRNVRIQELPDTEENWFRTNVIAEYEFDELG